jgi:hypothetical protein
LLSEHFTKAYSQQSAANLKVSFSVGEKYSTLSFDGYNDKMIEFVDLVSKDIKSFSDDMDQARFETLRAQQKKQFLNSLLNLNQCSDTYLKQIIKRF